MRGVVKFAVVALMTGVAAGQQPTPTPPPQRPIQTIRPSPSSRPQIQPARRVPQQAAMPVPQPTPPIPQPTPRPQQQPATAAQQPAATSAPAPAPTPVSLQPIRPSDMPPVPPQVTYRDNMLTVQAVNSTMGSLLTAIRNKTGIQFEGAENAGERVAVSIGPAPEGEVLASIFSGSGFDYVAVAREDNPNIVQRVIITPKARAGGGAPVFNPIQPQQPQAQPEPDEEVPDEQVDNEPQDTPAQPPPVTPPAQAEQQQQQQPKTPEQLLEELKQMQQQQQQGQQPPPNQAPKKMPPR